MKSSEQQLRNELAAAKRELRRRHREDETIRRRLVDLNDAFGALLGDDSVAPSRRDYSTTKSTSELLSDLHRKQIHLSAEQARKLISGKPEDTQAERLFERADSEYTAARGAPPGRDYLILYARSQVTKLGLSPETVEVLTDHRARKYIAQRNRLLDGGYMTEEDLIDPYLNADVDDLTVDN